MENDPERIAKFIELDNALRKMIESNPEEYEQVTAVVCLRKSDADFNFPDNVEGLCAICLEPIIYRPFSPKKPPKICSVCALTELTKEEASS
jgi:hypothetical protein